MNIDPPPLFPNMSPGIRPISTPTRKFTKYNQVFIYEEVQSLLLKDITKKSQSPWRAQVLIIKDERHK